MSASDHLSPDQFGPEFEPTDSRSWGMGPHRFSRVSKNGTVMRNSEMVANSLGNVENRDRRDNDDLSDMSASNYDFENRPSLYGFKPQTTFRWNN